MHAKRSEVRGVSVWNFFNFTRDSITSVPFNINDAKISICVSQRLMDYVEKQCSMQMLLSNVQYKYLSCYLNNLSCIVKTSTCTVLAGSIFRLVVV